ncbi:hypothetical protein NDU88_000244 [Pleurodeles waltl]|uniref:Uncharacterized protein n=1 Tax=Pleurodeles waltl TaxID=8319 RepID=A0AAV7LI01_PLEWA|nr:hypothetical protein NDU88_000244 [Pleurodeles waltl]
MWDAHRAFLRRILTGVSRRQGTYKEELLRETVRQNLGSVERPIVNEEEANDMKSLFTVDEDEACIKTA